jgi:predicted dehydrogenase
MGGGVLLDLSHEPDYVSWIFGPVRKITGAAAKVSRLKINSEDSADMLFDLKNGAAIPVHLDFCSYNCERSVKVMTKDCFFHLDLIHNTLLRRDARGESVRRYKIDKDFTYRKQIEYFLTHAGKKTMMNTPGEAGNLLSKLLEFRKKVL